MATSPVLVSLEEYLHTSYHPDADFVDGEIEERNLGEYQHARMQSLLSSFFIAKEDAWQIEAVVEQRIRINSSRVRVCDVAVLRANTPHEPVTATPPLLCIEVMSPEDRLARAKAVLADYFAMGVPNIWLIDPIRRVAYTYSNAGLREADVANLTVPGTPIRIDLTDIFVKLDKKKDSNQSL